MASSEYWAERFEAMHDAILDDGAAYYDDAERLFRKASESIQADISTWYMRLAKNNQVTLAEAQKLLRDDELKEFHWTVEEYIQHGRESGKIRGAWAKELENASAKFHISRLQALQLQMQQHLEELYGNYTDGLDTAMGDVYKAGYYKTAYTLQSGFHMGFDVAQIPKDQVDAVLSKPWAADGSNFSDRIWKDKDKLQRNLQDILTQGLVRGDSIKKMAKDMAERMNVARSNAARLIATESAYFASKGELDNMKELGVKEYEFVATLDSRTSDICRSMDGKVIPLKDFKPGTTAPPLHCYCRSCTVPHVGTVENFQKMRAARDPKTGKTVRIPDMTYQDWYDIFVAKKQTLDVWKKTKVSVSVENLIERVSKIDLKDCTVEDVINIGREVDEYFDITSKIGDKGALKEIFSNFREMGGQIPKERFAKGSNADNKKRLNDSFSVYPKAWADYLEKTDKKLYTGKVERGFFSAGAVMKNGKYYNTKLPNWKTGYVTIHLSERITTPFHEIGHFVEYFNPDALRISKAFLAKRTAGEKPVQLKNLFPDFNYGSKETTKADNFISPYIGKEYTNASEVLSIGLESLFEPRLYGQIKRRFLTNGKYTSEYAKITDDEEYLYLIIGLILKA